MDPFFERAPACYGMDADVEHTLKQSALSMYYADEGLNGCITDANSTHGILDMKKCYYNTLLHCVL